MRTTLALGVLLLVGCGTSNKTHTSLAPLIKQLQAKGVEGNPEMLTGFALFLISPEVKEGTRWIYGANSSVGFLLIRLATPEAAESIRLQSPKEDNGRKREILRNGNIVVFINSDYPHKDKVVSVFTWH